MTDDIVQWLQEEKRVCKEKYDEIYGRYAIGQEEKAAANWFSGRIETCEGLLKFISEGAIEYLEEK
jgi:hypothetical protein